MKQNILKLMLIACLVLMTAPAPSSAQESIYDPQLQRLASIIGSVHYLRNLCLDKKEDVWRTKMLELLQFEAPEPKRKSALTAAFNRGYRAYAALHIKCTPNAILAEKQIRILGESLAIDIVARYGN